MFLYVLTHLLTSANSSRSCCHDRHVAPSTRSYGALGGLWKAPCTPPQVCITPHDTTCLIDENMKKSLFMCDMMSICRHDCTAHMHESIRFTLATTAALPGLVWPCSQTLRFSCRDGPAGEVLPWPFRVSAIAPVNIPLVWGMLVSRLGGCHDALSGPCFFLFGGQALRQLAI